MRLLIVIVNYRTSALALDCLRSLEPEVAANEAVRVVVTDNASGDDSPQRLASAIEQAGWGRWASFMPLDRNGGFAFGNNAVIRPALDSDDAPDYVLLLNPDTIVREGALRHLLRFMDEHPQVGIGGSRLEHRDGKVQRSAFRFQTIASEFERAARMKPVSQWLASRITAPPPQSSPHETDWVSGACMIVRRAVFEQVGLLDEGYFMYFEEEDFAWRARQAGWPCWYVPASRVIHLIGQSSGMGEGNRPAKRMPRFWFESRRRFFTRSYGRLYAFRADAMFALGLGLWRLRCLAQRRSFNDPPAFFRDFLRFSFTPAPSSHASVSEPRTGAAA